MVNPNLVREPMAEDILYPSDPNRIKAMVSRALHGAPCGFPQVSALENGLLMVPQGAMDLVGPAVAWGIHCHRERTYRRAIIIAPALSDTVSPGIYLPESGIFSTPLGRSSVDDDFMDIMAGSSTDMAISDIPHLAELGIESFLPYLQYYWKNSLKIVPVIVSGFSSVIFRSMLASIKMAVAESDGPSLLVTMLSPGSYEYESKASEEQELFTRLLGNHDHEQIFQIGTRATTGRCLWAMGTIAASLKPSSMHRVNNFADRSPETQRWLSFASYCGSW